MNLGIKGFIVLILTIITVSSCEKDSLDLADNNKKTATSVNYQLKDFYTHVGPDKSNYEIKSMIHDLSASNDSRQFMTLRIFIGGLNIIVENTDDESFIQYYRSVIDDLLNTAQVSSQIEGDKNYSDNYKGWISRSVNYSYMNEVPLYESYIFPYITRFLYYLKQKGWNNYNEENKQWYNNTLAFIETNIWTKWRDRSGKSLPERYFLRSRTHMGSHWAGVALYLKRITDNDTIKTQCTQLINHYDWLLKQNLKLNPDENSAYVWNWTYDNVGSTDAIPGSASSSVEVQDVQHGNHVLSYITSAYKLGNPSWTDTDMQRLSNTFKKVIYNSDDHTLANRVDGTLKNGSSGRGYYVADGWAKLANFDPEIAEIIQDSVSPEHKLRDYNRGLQLKAIFKFLPEPEMDDDPDSNGDENGSNDGAEEPTTNPRIITKFPRFNF